MVLINSKSKKEPAGGSSVKSPGLHPANRAARRKIGLRSSPVVLLSGFSAVFPDTADALLVRRTQPVGTCFAAFGQRASKICHRDEPEKITIAKDHLAHEWWADGSEFKSLNAGASGAAITRVTPPAGSLVELFVLKALSSKSNPGYDNLTPDEVSDNIRRERDLLEYLHSDKYIKSPCRQSGAHFPIVGLVDVTTTLDTPTHHHAITMRAYDKNLRAAPQYGPTKQMLKQLVQVLDVLLSAGVAHLDIKPDNILLDTNKSLYLTDFGLATPTVRVDGLDLKAYHPDITTIKRVTSGGDIKHPELVGYSCCSRGSPLYAAVQAKINDSGCSYLPSEDLHAVLVTAFFVLQKAAGLNPGAGRFYDMNTDPNKTKYAGTTNAVAESVDAKTIQNTSTWRKWAMVADKLKEKDLALVAHKFAETHVLLHKVRWEINTLGYDATGEKLKDIKELYHETLLHLRAFIDGAACGPNPLQKLLGWLKQ